MTESLASTVSGEHSPAVPLARVPWVTRDGLDELVDALVLKIEIMELCADLNTHAEEFLFWTPEVVADCIIRWGSNMERSNIVLSEVQMGKLIEKYYASEPHSKVLLRWRL